MKRDKILKIITKIIVDIIIFVLGIMAILVIWGFIQINIQNREYVDIFGYSILSAETGSMSPTIEKGDIIIIKIGDEIKENDIITYKQENVLITHRVEKIEDDIIIAKGDYNNVQDESIKKNQVIGKAVFIINNVEIWKKVFTDINVVVPIIITIILFIIMVSYKEKTGDKNVRQEKNN